MALFIVFMVFYCVMQVFCGGFEKNENKIKVFMNTVALIAN